MVGKKSGKALREEGLERTDNNMDLTTWPVVGMINQKNYYTEYLKRDDQILVFRLQNEERRNRMATNAKDRDRALAHARPNELPLPDGDMDIDDDIAAEDGAGTLTGQDALGSKVIVIHPGSQNMRIGLATDALPKTVPMVVARKWKRNESEENGGEPKPKRIKQEHDAVVEPERLFGEEFATQYSTMCADLKVHMRNNKRRVLPNSKELVVNYNRRTPPETISEHNDPLRIDWTDISPDPKDAPDILTGKEALRIPDNSKPRYKLFWPLQRGWYNERDYSSKTLLYEDISIIIEEAIKTQLNLQRKKEWSQYDCVFVIPDLYERVYVTQILEMLLREFGFGRVCFIQESLAATFGAGYTSACVVDIGAQKTSICCVEEGMCIENSRINLKYGGADVTETFIKMMLFDHFPYADINLKRRYDFLLAEELKAKFCTMNEADISVQLYDFHVRACGQDTRKYMFKTYDEVLLAPMGYFLPSIFDNAVKLVGRRKLIDRSYDLYDSSPNDPMSSAQASIYQQIGPPPTLNDEVPGMTENGPNGTATALTPNRQQPFSLLSRLNDLDTTPRSSMAGSPAPEGNGTPAPGGAATPAVATNGGPTETNDTKLASAILQDSILPIIPLDAAILTSIVHGAREDDRKTRDFLGGIMVIGGGSQIPGFYTFLEERMKEIRPGFAKDIMIGTPPRELDPQVVVWKGGSVFGKLGAEDEEVAESEEDTMSNASSRPERVYHQDYIARIRYSNALPPPPGPPKLLDIPTDGLARYTSAGFASRMAREQPINIEVDAELGMPIDLVGMPGIFDGDESSIMALLNPPPVHPRDKALLRPLASLGKPKSVTSGVSFLRRTEYISSEQSRSRFESNTSRNLIKSTGKARKQKQTDASRNDPVNIMRSVVKGFDIAHPEDAYKGPDSGSNIRGAAPTQAEVAAWKKPKHPSKPGLTVVDSYPVLPHLDAFPDAGGYMVAKFSTNPSQATDAYDKRLDVGLLQPLPLRPEIIAEQEAKRLAHEADPVHHAPAGAPPYDYAYYLPTDEKSVPNIKKKFDINDPQKDDDSLYTSKVKDTQDGCFQYGRVRAYETGTSTTNLDQKYGEIALALHDSKEGAEAKGDGSDKSTLEKAAYYYPIISKSQLKPRRPRNIAQPGRNQEEEEAEQVDYLDVTVRDADEDETSARATHRAEIDVKLEQLGLTESLYENPGEAK